MMNGVRKFLEGLSKREDLKVFRPLIKAVDGFFFGVSRTTTPSPYLPHVVDNIDVKRYMSVVILALLPSVVAGVYFFGIRVILLIVVSYICGGTAEVLFAIVRKRDVEEGFLVTGLIFPLLLPPSVPLWVVGVGVVFGVVFGKEVFGGTGRNIFNPAMVGRLFLSVAFPAIMAADWREPILGGAGGFLKFTPDLVTSATPLIVYKTSHTLTPFTSLLLGKTAGSVGETFRLGIILGGIFLVWTKVANWRIPVAYITSVVIFSLIGNQLWPERFAPPLFQVFSGGLLFAAFFMATDPVTSPFTRAGKWIFGILLGILTVLIRGVSGYVEGVMFSLVLMNGFAPLIDELVLDRKFKARSLEVR